MAIGIVKWFDSQKGYGYIQPQGGGRDVFVHISSIERAGLATLNEGQHVEFEIEENLDRSDLADELVNDAARAAVDQDLFDHLVRDGRDLAGR